MGGNGLVVRLSQLIGRNDEMQPEMLASSRGSLLTAKGLFDERGTNLIYYVRETDVFTLSDKFMPGSQGKVKKIVTFPLSVQPTDIIRVNVFFYQNPTYVTKVTTIKDYEEEASWYMNLGEINYLANDVNQNKIEPN
jgi:hypothetical protein